MSDLVKRLRELETKLPTSSDNWIEARELQLDAAARIEALEAALNSEERQHIQTIDQRDAAESAISRAYQIVTGSDPEWSNHFTFADAIEAIENTIANLRHAASLLGPKT